MSAGDWFENASKCVIQCPVGTWWRPPPLTSPSCCHWTSSILYPRLKRIYDCPDSRRDVIVRNSPARSPTRNRRFASHVPIDDRVDATTVTKPATTRMKCCRYCCKKVALLKKPSVEYRSAYLTSRGIIMNLMKSLPGALSLDYVKTFTVIALCQYIWFLFVKLLLGCI